MKILYSIFLLFGYVSVHAQTIPDSRTADWENSGYPGPIPSSSNIADVTSFGAVGDGITDDVTAIYDAINSLNGRRGIIYFPPGNYLVGLTINVPDSVIFRGASSDSTHVIFNLNNAPGNGFNISGSLNTAPVSVVSGANRGSNAIVVSDASSYNAGDFAEIMENNGAWDTQPSPWADNSVGQILRITRVSGDTLFTESALRIDYDLSLAARVRKIIPAREVGIECMNISRADAPATGVCYNIYFNYAANCWIRGVESSISVGSHIEADASTNISIRGCYIHHSYLYDGVSTHGYGITLFAHTGQCRIENNIMEHLRHSFSMQTGANGNVIAYNYSVDPFRTEIPNDASADISLHGHFPFSNLFEGNIVQNIQIDYTHGPSGPFNTFFRNRADGYGIVMSSGSYQSDSMNFAGNEVTNSAFLHGNYTLAGGAHFNFGNNIKGTITPAGTGPLPDSSCYLQGLPSFWTSTSFPVIGIPNTISSGSIPAKDRYSSGSYMTDCDDDVTIGIDLVNVDGINFFPNPASAQIKIEGLELMSAYSISLKDLQGKVLIKKNLNGNIHGYTLDFPEGIAKGIYLLEINLANKKIVKKIEVIK